MYDYDNNFKVMCLLMPETDEKTMILYDNNPNSWSVPVVGPRPPYYTNPRYAPYYPVI
ncbi:hypothetical protein [Lentibacillus sp. CBA3610]|uniref:hypothetical protein n=1 Tax=Lentibacillus sp. CBA3610 TaxID=2518176 RepID=UPI001595716F|nr:hypothetical protein [Lentibacillus sp. CBA3610]